MGNFLTLRPEVAALMEQPQTPEERRAEYQAQLRQREIVSAVVVLHILLAIALALSHGL